MGLAGVVNSDQRPDRTSFRNCTAEYEAGPSMVFCSASLAIRSLANSPLSTDACAVRTRFITPTGSMRRSSSGCTRNDGTVNALLRRNWVASVCRARGTGVKRTPVCPM